MREAGQMDQSRPSSPLETVHEEEQRARRRTKSKPRKQLRKVCCHLPHALTASMAPLSLTGRYPSQECVAWFVVPFPWTDWKLIFGEGPKQQEIPTASPQAKTLRNKVAKALPVTPEQARAQPAKTVPFIPRNKRASEPRARSDRTSPPPRRPLRNRS